MKFKIQIPDWHGDEWAELEAVDAEHAAANAVEAFVYRAAAYERIGGDPTVIRVCDGETVTTWEVRIEQSLDFIARRVIVDEPERRQNSHEICPP